MATFPADPLADGIEAYGRRLRRRETTVVKTVEAYLARIAAVDGRIQSYEHVAKDLALAEARAADALIAAGTDLGPLMGVPVGVKDLLAVDGTPTTAGSRLDVRKQIGAEGPFVKRLKALGCIILGKTKTVEFAIGGTGISGARGCPWNPWDAKVQRTPGGSSSGSGAAMAAGLCGFAIGSDTGGSVRSPAGFCGTFGLKTTKGRWPTEGVFPLSRTLDTLGLLTRSAADAAIVLAAYEGLPAIDPAPPRGIRLGRPRSYFFDELEPDVRRCLEAAIDRLAKAGVVIDDTDVPEADIGPEFRPFIATELVAELGGREGFAASRAQIDPVIAKRVETGTKSMADEYVRLMWRHEELVRLAQGWMEGFDGWICPGNPYMAKPLTDYDDPATENTISYIVSRTNRLANLFGLCAIVSPVQQLGAKLPVPLQVMCPGGNDVEALAIGRTIEAVLGVGPTPDIAAFAAKVAA